MPASKKDDDKAEGHFNDVTGVTRAADTDAPRRTMLVEEAPAEPKPSRAKKDAEPAEPQQHERTIEQLLADRSFDREGTVRSKLAAYSGKHGVGQKAPLDLVDADGKPVAQPA